MSPRNLIDVEMEQTGEAAKSSSYRARQANSDTARRRSAMSSILSKASGVSQFNPYPQSNMKNPATGQSWFETPSAEYQAWEKRGLDNELAARKTQGDQDIAYTDTIITKLRPKANDEANRALGNELKTRFPYAQYENEAKIINDSASTLANSSVLSSFNNLVANSFPKQYVNF